MGNGARGRNALTDGDPGMGQGTGSGKPPGIAGRIRSWGGGVKRGTGGLAGACGLRCLRWAGGGRGPAVRASLR